MIEGTWKTDGLDFDDKASWSVSPVADDETAFEHQASVSGGTPMNVYFQPHDIESPLQHYFLQVQVVSKPKSASLSVGVVQPDEFRKGWAIQGMFYNGNLTNGSAALHTSFGPFLQEGDTVVVEYRETSHNRQQVSIVLNGKKLGVAFAIPKVEGSFFLPCLHMQGENLVLRTQVLSERKRGMVTIQEDKHSLFGKWSLTRLIQASSSPNTKDPVVLWPNADDAANNSNPIHLELSSTIIPAAIPSPLPISFAFHVANRLTVKKTYQPEPDEHGNIQAYILESENERAMVCMTRMMAPPPLRAIESYIAQTLEHGGTWHNLQVAADGTLVVKDSHGNIVATFARAAPAPALTTYKQ